MTDNSPSKHDTKIHWRNIAGVMLLVGAGMVVIAGVTAPLLIATEKQTFSTTAAIFGSGVVLVSLLGLLPLALMTRENLVALLKAFFTGSALRFILTILWVVVAALNLHWSPIVIVYTLALTYLPLLFTEVLLMNKAMRSSPLQSSNPNTEALA